MTHHLPALDAVLLDDHFLDVVGGGGALRERRWLFAPGQLDNVMNQKVEFDRETAHALFDLSGEGTHFHLVI